MALEPDELRESARDAHQARVVRLQDELEKMIKLCAWARESLENELFDGLGYKKLGISDKDLRKLKDLTTTYNSAVDAKIRFDKAQKMLAATMTPAEERAAVVTYIESCNWDDRNLVRQMLLDRGIWKGINWDVVRTH